MSEMNQLTTIIKRLEAATSRLEDLAVAGASAQTIGSAPAAAPPAPPTEASKAAAVPASARAPFAQEEEVPKLVLAYDTDVVDAALKPWLELTRSFAAPSVIEQVGIVERMFTHQRAILLQASACKKPGQEELGNLLQPLHLDIEAINKTKEIYRKDREWQNHLTFVAEGAPTVGWVMVSPKPGPHIKEMMDSADYYGNRVLKEFKDKDSKHAEWVKGYKALSEALRKYVMNYHTTGMTWNDKNGMLCKDYKPPASAQPAATASAAAAAPPPPPPPPGPPPPPPPPAPAASAPAPAAGGINAVFADLNRGENVTKGLRKVDKSEMTHKNPALRAQPGVAPKAVTDKRPVLPRKPQSLQTKKPPRFQLDGLKWLIENHESGVVTVEETENNQTVNIFNCKATTVVIKGKINAVTLLNCSKTSVLVESVISSISVTASPSFTIQITGTAPTIQIDTTDSGQIYLSKMCLDQTEIITAKCSSINISIPVEGEEDGVFDEKPVPEMFRSTVKGGKLVTAIVEHSG